MTRHYGNRMRTRADRERDLLLFLHGARPEVVARETVRSLAERYGVTEAAVRRILEARDAPQ